MASIRSLMFFSLVLAALAACSPKPETATEDASQSEESSLVSAAASQAAVDAVTKSFDVAGYVGAWKGAAGNTLTITPNGTSYTITIKTTAGSRDFTGTIVDGSISFTRDGSTFVITQGDGADTGQPELAKKSNCLLVAAGEGYCR